MSPNAACNLDRIGWLYVLFGVLGLIEQVVGLFVPIERRLYSVHILIPGFNLAVLWLPVGLGLLRRKAWWYRAAIVMNWLALTGFALVLSLFAVLAVTRREVEWKPNALTSGEDYRDLLVGVLVVLPILVWQFLVLRSGEVRELFETTRKRAARAALGARAEGP